MKRVLIGGICSIILLIVIPTSSAIHFNALQENSNSYSSEQFKYSQNEHEVLEGIIHPFLYKIIIPTLFCRMFLSLALTQISGEYIKSWHGAGYWIISYPLLFLYSIRSFLKYYTRLSFWDYLSNTLDWHWDVL